MASHTNAKTKNAHDVLIQKELEVARLKIELEALRIVGPLLSDEGDRDGRAVTSVAMPSLLQAKTAIDSHHAFSSRSERWREAVKRLFPATFIGRHS